MDGPSQDLNATLQGRPASADRYLRYFKYRNRYQNTGNGKLNDVGPVSGSMYSGLKTFTLRVAVCDVVVHYILKAPCGQT